MPNCYYYIQIHYFYTTRCSHLPLFTTLRALPLYKCRFEMRRPIRTDFLTIFTFVKRSMINLEQLDSSSVKHNNLLNFTPTWCCIQLTRNKRIFPIIPGGAMIGRYYFEIADPEKKRTCVTGFHIGNYIQDI